MLTYKCEKNWRLTLSMFYALIKGSQDQVRKQDSAGSRCVSWGCQLPVSPVARFKRGWRNINTCPLQPVQVRLTGVGWSGGYHTFKSSSEFLTYPLKLLFVLFLSLNVITQWAYLMDPNSGRGWISLVVLAKNTHNKIGRKRKKQRALCRSGAGQIHKQLPENVILYF